MASLNRLGNGWLSGRCAWNWLKCGRPRTFSVGGSSRSTAAGGPATQGTSTRTSSASLTVYSSASTGTTASNATETWVDVGHGRASIKHRRTIADTHPDCGD
jgi:hypothetical protein